MVALELNTFHKIIKVYKKWLTKTKDGGYLANLDKYKSLGTHWITLFCNNNVTYIGSFSFEHVPKLIKNL